MKKTAIAAALMFGAGIANAASVSTGGVFNMYSQQGLDQAFPDIIGCITACPAPPINVDATISGFVDQAAGTWGVSSTAPFYGLPWSASNGTLITVPGNYALDTTTGHASLAAPDLVGTADAQMHFSIRTGQIGGLIDFAWGATTGIRVVNVWDIQANGSLLAAKAPGMENGPFPGFNAAFNLTGAGLASPTPVPVPAALWLFGSGLMGLVGVARRKNASA